MKRRKKRELDRRSFLGKGLFLPLSLALPASCGRGVRSVLRRSFPALGTAARIHLEGPSRASLEKAAQAVEGAFREGEALLSPFHPGSALSRLCREAGRRTVPVGPVLGELIGVSRKAWERTEGAFDPTVAPLVRAFRLNGGGRIPSKEEFLEAREKVGMARLEWDPVEGKIRFPSPGFGLDPCGAGKGLVLDLAARAARDAGAAAGLLEAGGDLIAFGPALFPVGLRVKGIQGGVVSLFPLGERALAASGLLERVVRAGRREFGHVLDPRTGEPLDPEDPDVPLTAAAAAPTGAEADALATGLLVLGKEGLAVLEKIPGVEGLLVLRDGKGGFRLVRTRGFPVYRKT